MTWGNQAPAQYTARLSGSNIKMQTDIVGQHGVVNNDLPYVSGTTSDKVSFGRIKGEGTFCSLTRYTSSNSQKRILLGGKPGGASNWLHGHWGGFAGTAYYSGWVFRNSGVCDSKNQLGSNVLAERGYPRLHQRQTNNDRYGDNSSKGRIRCLHQS